MVDPVLFRDLEFVTILVLNRGERLVYLSLIASGVEKSNTIMQLQQMQCVLISLNPRTVNFLGRQQRLEA